MVLGLPTVDEGAGWWRPAHVFVHLVPVIHRQEPEDKYKLMLKEAGWRDRTEEEGIWTKQIPRDSGWQPAADAERLFKQIANEIRAAKGLGAVLSL
jgi:hypothetical protein